LRLLETAFDAGIRYFDTARLYGFGHAEGIVGDFLQGKRDAVTVATKFGLEPPSGPANNPHLIAFAKKLVRRMPFIARRLRRHVTTMVRSSSFTPEAAARSIEKSLAELRTDRIDVLLLHECAFADTQDEPLRAFLEVQVARGTIGTFGVATNADQLPHDLALLPPAFHVVQLQDSLLEPRLRTFAGRDSRWTITHSALKPIRALAAAVASRPAVAARWSERLGVDLTQPENLAPLLLASALDANETGTVLFSTTRPERITENVRRAEAFTDQPGFASFVEEIIPKGAATSA
jgi:diketogulonate reductase-like aldo/keto reductase